MPKKKGAEKSDAAQFAAMVAGKIGETATLLVSRNWGDIKSVMENDNGEIKLSLSATITDREPTPGENADKDNRIRVVLSFSEKHTDSSESDLPDPNQPELPTQEETE